MNAFAICPMTTAANADPDVERKAGPAGNGCPGRHPLFQQSTYRYGRAYTFQSNLPVLGGLNTQQYPGGGPRARVGHARYFIFPACENEVFDFTKHQKTFRTAWRTLVKNIAKRAGDEAAKNALGAGLDPESARRNAARPFLGFRFHDLRHQSITEMAEAGVP